jgi:hypothetical protein
MERSGGVDLLGWVDDSQPSLCHPSAAHPTEPQFARRDAEHQEVHPAKSTREAMSFSDTIQPVCPCITSAWGATASHSFIAPHSSAS